MSRLLSSVLVAGVLALGISTSASAAPGHHGKHHGPQCKTVTHCEFKRTKWGRLKKVCVTKRVCRDSHGHGHH